MRWREVLFPSSNSDIWKSVVLLIKSPTSFSSQKEWSPATEYPNSTK